jgi:hypothetical protein
MDNIYRLTNIHGKKSITLQKISRKHTELSITIHFGSPEKCAYRRRQTTAVTSAVITSFSNHSGLPPGFQYIKRSNLGLLRAFL